MKLSKTGRTVYAEIGFWLEKDGSSIHLTIKDLANGHVAVTSDPSKASGHPALHERLSDALNKMQTARTAITIRWIEKTKYPWLPEILFCCDNRSEWAVEESLRPHNVRDALVNICNKVESVAPGSLAILAELEDEEYRTNSRRKRRYLARSPADVYPHSPERSCAFRRSRSLIPCEADRSFQVKPIT